MRLRLLPTLTKRLAAVQAKLRYSTRPAVATYEVGQNLPCDWKVANVTSCPELNLFPVVLLKHRRCGAQWLHLGCPGEETNAFSVHFKTVPMNSTGIAHILEHVSLCGSHKYPVRDPFFKMLNRSLSSFMNAMTGPDYTLYPYSTQNRQDFYNLMSVYLDAVFRPLLSEQDFMQEGWRLDVDERDPAKLMLKGIVFNEMKGVFADSQQLFSRQLMNELLPSHTYGICSGGLPEKIPELTWKSLKDFHAKHYSADNAKFYTYGCLPLEDHLRVAEEYLSQSDQDDLTSSVPDVPSEPRWTSPRRKHIDCASDPSNPTQKNSTVSMSYLACDVEDTYQCFVLEMIGQLLLDGPSTPFYKSLIETRLGSGFASCSGYDAHTKDTTFTIGVQGVHADDFDKVEAVINDTFKNVCQTGFERERIEAILHGTELALKHKVDNFGLNLIIGLTAGWNHVKDPFKLLRINENIERFRKELTNNPTYLEDKIRRYFVDNAHHVVLTMSPKEGYLEESEKIIADVESKLVGRLTDGQRQSVKEAGEKLLEDQLSKTSEEALSCLPTLTVSDIALTAPKHRVDELKGNSFNLGQVTSQPTNGVSYFRALFDASDVEHERYYPMFSSVLTSMGAGEKYDFRELETQIDLHTGGLSSCSHLSESPVDLASLNKRGLLISSHCLERNTEKMFELWLDVFNNVFAKRDDALRERLISLINMSATDSVSGFAYAGHHYAMAHAASRLAPLGLPATRVRETHGGVSSIRFVNKLAQSINNGNLDVVDEILDDFAKMARTVLRRSRVDSVCVNVTEDHRDRFVDRTKSFLDNLPLDSKLENKSASGTAGEDASLKTYIAAPFPVHYCGKALPTVHYEHPDSAALRILAKLLSAKFLHQQIREKGGAYGGRATSNPSSGVFSFYSYRDPNCSQTLDVFEKSLEWVTAPGSFSKRDVEEAKLGIFQAVDKPVLPGQVGVRRFLTQITDETFQEHRTRLREVSDVDIKRVAKAYLDSSKAGVTVVGPESSGKALDSTWIVQDFLG